MIDPFAPIRRRLQARRRDRAATAHWQATRLLTPYHGDSMRDVRRRMRTRAGDDALTVVVQRGRGR